MTKERSTSKLFATIACGVMIFINFGVAGMFSPLIPTFMSELGISATSASMGPLLAGLASVIFTTVGTRLMKKIGPKKMLYIADIIAVISGLIHFNISNVGMLYIGSILNGAVIAMGTNAVISSMLEVIHGKSFQDVLGVVLGVGIFGTTGATAFVALMQSTLGWRAGYLIFCTFGGAVCLLLNLLFVPRGEGAKTNKKEAETAKQPEQSEVASQPAADGLTKAEAVKSKAYKLMIVAVLLTATLYASVSSFAASYWQGHGVAPATSTLWLTMITLVGGILTMVSGVILSKLGTKMYLAISYLGYAAGVICLIIWGIRPATVFAILAIVLIACVRMVNGLVAMMVPDLFGRKDYANINIGLMPFQFIGGMLGVPIAGAIFDATGSLVPVFILATSFALISCALMFTGLRITPYKK